MFRGAHAARKANAVGSQVFWYGKRVRLSEIPVSELVSGDAYRLMTEIIAPRPIAWVSTQNGDGQRNLAPFSYFQAVCSDPPTIVLSVGWHPDGRPKDTLANILELGEFTVSHVSRSQAEAMNTSSAALPPEHSEWEFAGVSPEPAQTVLPPRVAGSMASMECRLVHAMPIGQRANGSPSVSLIVAEVQHFAVSADVFARDDGGKLRAVNPSALDALARMGGPTYATSTDRFDLPRPKAPTSGQGKGHAS